MKVWENSKKLWKHSPAARVPTAFLVLPNFHSCFYLTILRRKKDGDWYIYPQFLAHENFKNVHKKAQKGCKIFKPTIHNVLTTGTNIVKIWLSLCLIRCVRFARYCGKMYSRHLFSYGGLDYELEISMR